jgi:hypothetical protein
MAAEVKQAEYERQDVDLFLLHRLELARIESEGLDGCRCDLLI